MPMSFFHSRSLQLPSNWAGPNCQLSYSSCSVWRVSPAVHTVQRCSQFVFRAHCFISSFWATLFEKIQNFSTPQHLIPFPHGVFSDTACAASNSSASVIKGSSFLQWVDLQCPQAPWMLPAGWSHYEPSRSIPGSTEPGGAKIWDVLPGRRTKLLLWRLGFVQENEGISAQRRLTPWTRKSIPLMLEATGSAAGMRAGLSEEDCNLSACNNQCITTFLRNIRYVSVSTGPSALPSASPSRRTCSVGKQKSNLNHQLHWATENKRQALS